jgi:hypothetical protein
VAPPTSEADQEAVDTADQEDTAHEDRPKPDSSVSGRAVIVLGIAVVVLVVALLVMVPAYIRLRNNQGSDSSDRNTVATTASRAAEAMTSLDASGPNTAQADVIRQLGTDPFIQQYVSGIESIRKLFGPLKVSSERGTVTKVYVSDIDKDQAEVIVVVDLVLVAETPRVVPNQYLRVHLAKLSGQWKVDNVEDLNVSLAATASGGASTTTTPAAPSGTGSSSG